MEDHGGLKRALSFSWAYSFFQNLVGAHRARIWIAENFWRVTVGQKIVDFGCGPGTVLGYLPQDIEYAGFDISDEYIETARRVHADKKNTTFFKSDVHSLLGTHDARLANADLVLCNGLLHHLNDAEAVEVFRLAQEIMKPSGRLVCVEPVFLVHQSAFSRWLMSKDRGCNIRTEQQWRDLARKVFERYATSISVDLIRIPYVHIFIEGWSDSI